MRGSIALQMSESLALWLSLQSDWGHPIEDRPGYGAEAEGQQHQLPLHLQIVLPFLPPPLPAHQCIQLTAVSFAFPGK